MYRYLIYCLSLFFLSSCATLVTKKHLGGIPARDKAAFTGSQFISSLSTLTRYQREVRILKQLRRGNIPNYLRKLKPVKFKHRFADGVLIFGKIWVTPDYLAVGSNKDFVRVPMNPITAQRVADHYGFILPTTKMVDQIYRQADVKLKPNSFKPGKSMAMTHKFVHHHKVIEYQLDKVRSSRRSLVAGHKKDVVISNRLLLRKRRVAIYGWHKPDGKAIQPLSTVHGNYYSDYSHGVRLVSGMMEVNGRAIPVAEVLEDPRLSQLLSKDGPMNQVRYPTEGLVTPKLGM